MGKKRRRKKPQCPMEMNRSPEQNPQKEEKQPRPRKRALTIKNGLAVGATILRGVEMAMYNQEPNFLFRLLFDIALGVFAGFALDEYFKRRRLSIAGGIAFTLLWFGADYPTLSKAWRANQENIASNNSGGSGQILFSIFSSGFFNRITQNFDHATINVIPPSADVKDGRDAEHGLIPSNFVFHLRDRDGVYRVLNPGNKAGFRFPKQGSFSLKVENLSHDVTLPDYFIDTWITGCNFSTPSKNWQEATLELKDLNQVEAPRSQVGFVFYASKDNLALPLTPGAKQTLPDLAIDCNGTHRGEFYVGIRRGGNLIKYGPNEFSFGH